MLDDETPGNVEDAEEMMQLVARDLRDAEPGVRLDAPDTAASSLLAAKNEARSEEKKLALSAREGDTDAFAELMRRRTPGVLAFLRRMLGDAEDARDVAQLTFLKAWENLSRYDSSWAFSTWLFRIAGNLAIDALRARGTRSRTEAENFRLVRGGRGVADPDGPMGLEREGVRRVFEGCATALSEKQRLVFVLREFEEKESAEIAVILDCRESTVRNHLFQARKLLREEIRERFPEFLPKGSA